MLFEEHHAHKVLTDFLEEQGFKVERSAFGLSTAFRASYGSVTDGGRTVAINLE